MASKVSGKNIMLYKYDSESATDIPIACSRSCTFEGSTSFKDVTNYQSNNYTQSKPDLNSWTVNADGFVILENYSYLLLLQDWDLQTELLIKFVVDNDVDGFAIVNGSAYISNVSILGNFNEYGTYSISLQGTGQVSFSGTQPDPSGVIIVNGEPLYRFQYTAVGGETTISVPAAIGKTLFVASSGTSSIDDILTSGTPSFGQVKWDTVAAVITLGGDAPLPGQKFSFVFQ